MDLNLLLLIPLITALALVFGKTAAVNRWIAFTGAAVQLVLSLLLLKAYYSERSAGNNSLMLFEQNIVWFKSLNINYHIGVDGISVAMILLTAFVVAAGILVSWKTPAATGGDGIMSKEFFFLLTLLSFGAYGFFISLDLFTLFFFLEVAVIPKFLLIGIWGSGKKEYSANKLALMLMGGSALVLVGMLGLYYNALSETTGFNLMALRTQVIPIQVQLIFFPFLSCQ